MARPKRGASKKGEPDIYGDMLAEAGVSAHASTSERPLKRRRAGPKTDDDDGEIKDVTSSPAQPAEQKSPGVKQDDAPAPMVQTMERESDDDEDEDMEFEDVEFEAWLQGDAKPLLEPQAPQDLELNLTAAMTPVKRQIERRKPLTREEKERRAHVHQMHLLCLLSHVARRNHWCNDPKVQQSLRAHLPEKLVTLLNPSPNLSQFGRTESLKRGLGELDKLWKAKFEITERGMRRALWAEDVNQLQDYELPEDMEVCHDREDFRAAARTLQGSRDVGAQLYCALLRSAGVRARLVCSLQPLACISGAPALPKPKKGPATTSLSKEDRVRASMANHEKMSKAARDEITAAAGSPTARRRLGHPGAASFNFESRAGRSQEKSKSSKVKTPRIIRESPYPIYWVEILDVGHQKWQPVDAVVTHTFWKPKAMEPPITDKENVLSYVVAFEGDGTARDVTRRYAKAYTAKTRRLRVETNVQGGDRWWRKAMRSFRRKRPENLDQIEDQELAGAEAREPMPRNVQDFKDHPVYALERHLRRHEVLLPDATPSGTVAAGTKGPLEKVYRRKDVRVGKTADKWYRSQGREVRPLEIPVKWLPKRARPRGRFGGMDDDENDNDDNDDGGENGVPIFTLDQTEPYVPPAVRNGKVPKNKFGNIDVYVPSMVPKGAVHLRMEEAARAAHIIGVDYAPALTGFSFKGRTGTAVLTGIVVAVEYEEAILAVIEGLRDLADEAVQERKRLVTMRWWRRFIMGLRIRERVWAGVSEEERREAERDAVMNAEMDEEMADEESDVTEEFDMEVDGDGGGGFLVGDDEGGGFIP
ncbi:nitrilase [Emericellopsis atlantica]|uniref:Nitrilase n=1 Tax=Emericellopsis atlantica TaxID=2614577 RepID=A0A9P7ZGX7_9HYPO|nr:nitrilase [Emericellopsis atlantica]KAG9251253.1 nitrilase [Emericellopsis atlantica]